MWKIGVGAALYELCVGHLVDKGGFTFLVVLNVNSEAQEFLEF